MQMLVTHGELYGQQLVKQSNGELGRGTVYVTLDRLEDKGFIASRVEDRQPGAIGLPRRMYAVTGLGARALQAIELSRIHFNGLLPGGAT